MDFVNPTGNGSCGRRWFFLDIVKAELLFSGIGLLCMQNPNPTHRPARSINTIMSGGVTDAAPHHVVATGFEPLDSALDGGLRTGDLILIGGLPGIG